MKVLITHPDNLETVRRVVIALLQKESPRDHFLYSFPPWLTIKTNRHIARYGPSKKIRMPNGTVVPREEFVLRTRFVTYGPEDLLWLMWAGVIEEQLELLFYLIDEPLAFRVFADFGGKLLRPNAALLVNFA